jgi:hypothetical protein
MENRILYSQVKTTNAINIARDLSWMNSKNEEVTTRDGHVYAYICNITVVSDAAAQLTVTTAPNSWKMRNSFRKWHAYRDMMFEEAGVSESEKGRYGKTIRPYLDPNFKAATQRVPTLSGDSGAGAGVATLGEWTYTEIAATPGFDTDAVGTEGGSIVDVYDLSICGINTVSSTTSLGTERYSNVGMIMSYNQDRQEVITPTLDSETVEGQNNPLALLRYKGASAGEVMNIAEDQELEAPPYDIRDNGDSIFPVISGLGQLTVGNGGQNADGSPKPLIPSKTMLTGLVVPAGMFVLTASAAGSVDVSGILVEVIGKVLCKDLA